MKKTALFEAHKRLGARIVDFAGWEMPVQYSGISEEHLAVRHQAGLFDVSHMGEIEIRGPQALALLQQVTCNDASRLSPGMSQYSALLTEQGTFVDDIMVYSLEKDYFLLCVNASNSDKDYQWIKAHALQGVEIENRSSSWGLIALQGPLARQILPSSLKKNRNERIRLEGIDCLLSCTGYTGEEGFELFLPWEGVETIWNFLLKKGAPNLLPCGLGARDTLRLEAGYPLYGHEIDEETTPFEAGLGWIVKMEKGDFIGRTALLDRKSQKRLVGIEMREAGIPRPGYRLYQGENEVGWVVSGTFSPLSQKGIAMAYLNHEKKETAGEKIHVDIRGKKREAVVVSLPFYKKHL